MLLRLVPVFFPYEVHPRHDFRIATKNDCGATSGRQREGIGAKRRSDPYLLEHANWLKIRSQNYSHWVGRDELFARERGSEPDLRVCYSCVAACNDVESFLAPELLSWY